MFSTRQRQLLTSALVEMLGEVEEGIEWAGDPSPVEVRDLMKLVEDGHGKPVTARLDFTADDGVKMPGPHSLMNCGALHVRRRIGPKDTVVIEAQTLLNGRTPGIWVECPVDRVPELVNILQ